MTRLEQIKDEVAKERFYNNWRELKTTVELKGVFVTNLESAWIDVCRRYAKECAQASLEKAATVIAERRGDKTIHDVILLEKYPVSTAYANKESICNPENIILP